MFSQTERAFDSDIDIGAREGVKAEFDAWRWVRFDELPALVIPFKRDVYDAVMREFADVWRRGGEGCWRR